MNAKARWARISFYVGAIALFVGALDPLEGSFVILAGAGLLVASEFLRGPEQRRPGYWLTVSVLVATGVGAMLALSSVGGIGGNTGRSMWWGLLILPYPAGWLLGAGRLIAQGVQALRRRSAAP